MAKGILIIDACEMKISLFLVKSTTKIDSEDSIY
jgi:hypothetical protein